MGIPSSQRTRIHTRIAVVSVITGLLVVAAIMLLKVMVQQNRLAERLEETRRSLDYGMASDDPTRVTRDYLDNALKQITPAALHEPTIVLALVPHWKNELCIYWIGAQPEVDGVEVRTMGGNVSIFPLDFYDLEQNRAEARTRVLYTNTLRSQEVETYLDESKARGHGQVVVTLLVHGVPSSATAPVMKWEPSGELVPLNGSSTTAPTDRSAK